MAIPPSTKLLGILATNVMSKGSKNSIKIPMCYNKNISKIGKFIRLGEGSTRLSKQYIKAFNMNIDQIIKLIEKIFDINPKYTSKKEPIFCSGVLRLFYSKMVSISPKKTELPRNVLL